MALVIATKAEGVMVLELNAPPANTYSYEMMRSPASGAARYGPARTA